MREFREAISDLIDSVKRRVVGQHRAIKLSIATVLTPGGHALLEEVPGTGKTLLVRSMAQAVGVDWKRVSGTPDLLPFDLIGNEMYSNKDGEWYFEPGPLFTDFLLVDENNRMSPKTQSALLEAMQEGRVTVARITHSLSRVFTVFATQNPIDIDGTYQLGEANTDRFLMKISMGYPSLAEEIMIIRESYTNEPEEPAISLEDLIGLQELTRKVTIDPKADTWMAKFIQASRVHEGVRLGLSPRVGQHLARACKSIALVNGRMHVETDDIQEVLEAVTLHRIHTDHGVDSKEVFDSLVAKNPLPVLLANLV